MSLCFLPPGAEAEERESRFKRPAAAHERNPRLLIRGLQNLVCIALPKDLRTRSITCSSCDAIGSLIYFRIDLLG